MGGDIYVDTDLLELQEANLLLLFDEGWETLVTYVPLVTVLLAHDSSYESSDSDFDSASDSEDDFSQMFQKTEFLCKQPGEDIITIK